MFKHKYRIIENWYSHNSAHYIVEKRIMLFFWERERTYAYLHEAQQCIVDLKKDATMPKDKVIHWE